MELYQKCEVLGKGTFGVVFKAIHKETGQIVAIKKIRLGQAKEGVDVTALREIKLLRELRNPHIVRLLDVFPHKRNLLLVFEYCETDLELVIRDRSLIFSAADVKSYMRQILRALAHCHRCWLLHRDIKPNNFLIAPTGVVKLADFGLSRIFGSPDRDFTNQVCSRWYRPPELLYGSTLYGPSVDIWSAGCVFAELLLRRPWFPGASDIDQLGRVYQALGTPTLEQWPTAAALPHYMEFNPLPAVPLNQIFRQASEEALDLLARMMAFDPARRITAQQALEHRYFQREPAPTPAAQLPRPAPRVSASSQAPAQSGGGVPAPGAPRPAAAQNGGAPVQQEAGFSPSHRAAAAEAAAAATASHSADRRRSHSDGGEPHSGPGTALERVSLNSSRRWLSRLSGQSESHLRPLDFGGAQHTVTPASAGPAPMSCLTGEEAERPKLASGDLRYLRKRKVAMDQLFEGAQDEEDVQATSQQRRLALDPHTGTAAQD